MRWVRRGCALAVLVIGWVFIAWQNHFHITAPVVFVCLAYLAVVATIYNLWRTGAVVVANEEDEGDSTWGKPAGALGELEREKRTLIKAIKEAEFDHQMGKLSQRDADEMIRTYRTRAIEVIKDLERLELGAAGSAREQILREVRARVELEARSNKKATEPRQAGKPANHQGKGKPRSLAADHATTEPATTSAETSAAAATEAATPEGVIEGGDDAQVAAQPVAQSMGQPMAQPMIDDDAMDADSTTTVEPKREDAAKEATP
jgi:hypothetical protein